MSKVIEKLIDILPFLTEVENDYKAMTKKLQEVDWEISDLQHELELSKLSAVELMRTTKELVKVLQKRREIKNEMHIMHHVKCCVSCGAKNIITSIKNMQKLIEYMPDKAYTPRVRTDIKLYKGKLKKIDEEK